MKNKRSPETFQSALQSAVIRYETKVTVAELRFSAGEKVGDLDKASDDMRAYLGVMTELAETHENLLPGFMFYSLFENAQFSPGVHNLHAVDGNCLPGHTCKLTPLGEAYEQAATEL